MSHLMTPHGFLLFMPTTGTPISEKEVYQALRNTGFCHNDGNGNPLFIVLESHAPKHQWFEAGYWAGARVPLFALGHGRIFRHRHQEAMGKIGGWAIEVTSTADLIAAIARRGIIPTPWDREQHILWLMEQQKGGVPTP